jgi:hypothetical protein
MVSHVSKGEVTLPLDCPTPAAGDELRQLAVGTQVRRIQEYGWGVDRSDFRPDQELQPSFFGSQVRADNARQGVLVRDSEGGQAERGGTLDELVGVGGPVEEREVRLAAKLGITGRWSPAFRRSSIVPEQRQWFTA